MNFKFTTKLEFLIPFIFKGLFVYISQCDIYVVLKVIVSKILKH